MATNSFVLRYEIEGAPFAAQFLAADDFDLVTIKNICQAFGLSAVGRKTDLIGSIERFLEFNHEGGIEVLYGLIRRNKNWLTFKKGKVENFPHLNDPMKIVFSTGDERWYGPIQLPDDSSAAWYIRPTLIITWEMDGDPPKPIARYVRWLMFAKVTSETLSFHWRGFTFATEEKHVKQASQFPYWNYVPNLIEEFEKIIGGKLDAPNLHDFVLHQLWENYRGHDNFTWTDLRIRAESGGVSLNARSAGVSDGVEIDVKGISHLAHTLSLSVTRELGISLDLVGQRHLQESILQTLIRQFGAKSYEFSLQHDSETLLKAHVYFGMKPNFPSADSFPHVNCHTSWKSDQDQLAFIIEQIENLPKNVSSQPIQPGLI
ncbi:MAG: hypothetical protein HY869_22065 [Chloroflexi bacterium]|nr:hypothetical protein [Chloroflexota bacterium]